MDWITFLIGVASGTVTTLVVFLALSVLASKPKAKLGQDVAIEDEAWDQLHKQPIRTMRGTLPRRGE